MISDILNKFGWRQKHFSLIVRDFEAKLILYRHNDFDMVKRVKTEVLHEMGIDGQLKKGEVIFRMGTKFCGRIQRLQFRTDAYSNKTPTKLRGLDLRVLGNTETDQIRTMIVLHDSGKYCTYFFRINFIIEPQHQQYSLLNDIEIKRSSTTKVSDTLEEIEGKKLKE